jgi:glycosyltransferase involved in cell wall biosynthesis
MKLSVAIIARDNEKEMEKCLLSVRGADEIVVLDTGSKDSTVEIARKYAKVYYYRWEDDFAAARNKALEYCSGNWVFSIDTDEVLVTGIDSVYKAIEKNFSSNVIAVWLEDKDKSFMAHRLFRKTVYWHGAVHEELSKGAEVGTDTVKIWHEPSQNHKKDPERNLKIVMGILERNPYSMRDIYYMGSELHNLGRFDAALYWFNYFLEAAKGSPALSSEVYYLVADCYCNLGRASKAVDALTKAVNINNQFKSAYERLYQLTKKDIYKQRADCANNSNLLVVR